MSSSQRLHLPSSPSHESISRSRKQELKRDVLVWLEKNSLGWDSGSVELGSKFVTGLTNCLWYLDGQHSTLADRACHVPPEFQPFQGYNLPEKSHHRKRTAENLSAAILDHHSTVLNSFLLQSWLQVSLWKCVKSAVCNLADAIAKYSSYLKDKNQETQTNHSKLSPVRVLSESEKFCVIKQAQWVKPTLAAEYSSLQKQLDTCQEFEPLLVNDLAPANTR